MRTDGPREKIIPPPGDDQNQQIGPLTPSIKNEAGQQKEKSAQTGLHQHEKQESDRQEDKKGRPECEKPSVPRARLNFHAQCRSFRVPDHGDGQRRTRTGPLSSSKLLFPEAQDKRLIGFHSSTRLMTRQENFFIGFIDCSSSFPWRFCLKWGHAVDCTDYPECARGPQFPGKRNCCG